METEYTKEDAAFEKAVRSGEELPDYLEGLPLLHFACVHSMFGTVSALLDAEDVDPDQRDTYGRVALHLLLEESIESKVAHRLADRLISLGAKVNTRSGEQHMLHAAAFAGHRPLVRRLLDEKVLLSVRTFQGETPLHFAARHPEIMELLLERGARPDMRTLSGETAAFYAAAYGPVESLELLLDAGADPDATGDEGAPLHVAAEHEDSEFMNVLLEADADPNIRDGNGATPLHYAASAGRAENCRLLLDAGADPNAVDDYGHSPLDDFAPDDAWLDELRRGDVEFAGDEETVLELLESAGAERGSGESVEAFAEVLFETGDVDEVLRRLEKGELPADPQGLIVGVDLGEPKIVEWFLESGVSPDASRPSGLTALHVAAAIGELECVNLLLDAGASVTVTDDRGRTPLHHAAGATYDAAEELVDTLLDHGADPLATDKLGWTPQLIVLNRDEGEFARPAAVEIDLPAGLADRLFDEARCDIFTETGYTLLHAAASGGRLDIAHSCVEVGVAPERTNHFGRAPLHEAARTGRLEVVQWLLDSGVEVDSQDVAGATPLHLAASALHHDVAIALLGAGADPNTRDLRGRTPLHDALSGGLRHLLPELFEAGADQHARDHAGNTSLHFVANDAASEMEMTILSLRGPEEAVEAAETAEKIGRDAAEMLLAADAPVDARNAHGETPFLIAAANNQLATARLFVEAGADPHVRDQSGASALHHAANWRTYTTREATEMIEWLLELGLDPEATDDEGCTPAELATERIRPLLS